MSCPRSLGIAAFVLALSSAPALAQVELEAPPCEGAMSPAALEPLVRLEVGERLGPERGPVRVQIAAESCDSDHVHVRIFFGSFETEQDVSLAGLSGPASRARALALIVGVLAGTASTSPSATEASTSPPVTEEAPATTALGAALADPTAPDRRDALDAGHDPERDAAEPAASVAGEPAPARERDPERDAAERPVSGAPLAAQDSALGLRVRWAVLAEARGSAEAHVVLGGLHVGVGVCTPRLLDLLYGCARGDTGLLFGDHVDMPGLRTGQVTGGVSLEAGLHLARGLVLELGPRIELSHAWALSDAPPMLFPTQLMLGGLLRAGLHFGDVGVLAELEISGALPPFQLAWYPGFGGPVLIARLGIGY